MEGQDIWVGKNLMRGLERKEWQGGKESHMGTENKYNFKLKENTIKNIIDRWKNNSLKFTKYSTIENKFNKNGEFILYDYTNNRIYTWTKKKHINAENLI